MPMHISLRRFALTHIIFCVGLTANVLAIEPEKPRPKYDVKIERHVMVPMRDGLALETDVYLPMANGQQLNGKVGMFGSSYRTWVQSP